MITKRLQEVFNIHPDEGRMTVLVLGYAILLFSSNVLATTASLGLFFGTYDAATLPYTYVLLMFFGPLASLIYLRLNSLFNLAKALMGIHLFLLLSLILLPLILSRSAAPILRFSLPVYLGVIITLTYASFWNLLGRIYNLGQGKRLFPVLGSGEHLATVGAGFIATFIVARLGTVSLYWLAALCMAGAIALLVIISRANAHKMGNDEDSDREEGKSPSNLRALLKEPYVRLMFVAVSLYTISVVLVENLSFIEAEFRFPTADGMATYLGFFMGIYGALGLFVQWVIAGRALDRFGVTPVMLTLPGGLLIFMFIFALVGSLNSTTVALFWLSTGANMYAYTLDAPYAAARNVMLQPLPAGLRTQTQTTALGIAYPLAMGVSGLLLLLLNNVLGFQSVQLSYAILVVLALWLMAVLRLSRTYVRRLQQALQVRSLGGTAFLRSADRTSIVVLEAALSDRKSSVVLYALDTLAVVAPEVLPKRLPDLLAYPSDEVRLAALAHITALPWREAPPDIERLLASSPNPEVRAAALRTWHAVSPMPAGINLAAFGHDPQLPVRQAALAIMCGHDDPAMRRQAWEAINDLAQSANPDDRILAAGVIGELGNAEDVRVLGDTPLFLNLLQDQDPQVLLAALVAATSARLPMTWPAIIPSLAHKSTRPLATNALIAGGEEVLPLLKAACLEPEQDPHILTGIALLCGQIADPGAIAILEMLLDHPDDTIRRQAILGLSHCAYQVDSQKRETIVELFRSQAAELAQVVAAQVDIGDARQVRLTADALEQRRRLGTDNLLLLLSFLYDPQTVLSARDALQLGRFDEEKHAYAIEVLDILLDHRFSTILFPFVQQLEPQQRLAAAQRQFPQMLFGRERRLHLLLKEKDHRWTTICAIYALGLLEDSEATKHIIHAETGRSDDPVIVETMLGSLEQLGVSLETLAANPALETAVKRWNRRDPQSMTLLQKADSLKQASIFANLPEDALEAFSGLTNMIAVKQEKTIIHEGDLGNCLYVVVEGHLRIHENGRVFDTLGPGGVIGEMALLDAGPRSASVTAETDSRLLQLDQEPFYELLAGHPQVALELVGLLSRRLRERTSDLASWAQHEAVQPIPPVAGGQPGMMRGVTIQEELRHLDKLFILKGIEFFGNLDDDLMGQIAVLLEEVDLAGGEVLFRQGDPGRSLYIVAVGQVRVHIAERTLAYAGEGEVIGEMALLESQPRLATVTAVVPTQLLRLDQQPFFELLETRPALTRGIIKTLTSRQRARLQELTR